MNNTGAATLRQISFRTVGWLAVMAMLAVALLGPAASRSLAAHEIVVDDITLGSGFDNPCGEGATAIKINSGEFEAGTHTYVFGETGIKIELTAVLGEGNALDSVTVGTITGASIDAIFVHAGEGTTLVVVEGLVVNPEKDISFVLFCTMPVTTTTSVASTTSVQTTTSVETTTATTTTTSAGVSSTTSVQTTTSGGVSSTTQTGTITLPPTDTELGNGGNSALISFGLLALAIGGLLVSIARPLTSRKSDR